MIWEVYVYDMQSKEFLVCEIGVYDMWSKIF